MVCRLSTGFQRSSPAYLHESYDSTPSPGAHDFLHCVRNVPVPVRCQMLQGLKSKGENGEQGSQSNEVAGIGCHEECPQDSVSDETLERRLSHLGPKVYRRQGHKKNQTKRDPGAGNSKLIQKATFSRATKRLRRFRRPRGFPSKSELSNPPQSRPSMAELGFVITDRVSGPGTGSE
jgi:hypothetical protein